MALVFHGLEVGLVAYRIPKGHVKKTLKKAAGPGVITLEKSLVISKSTVETPVSLETFEALLSVLKTRVKELIKGNFNTLDNNVEGSARLVYIKTDGEGDADASKIYTNEKQNFICGIEIKVKIETPEEAKVREEAEAKEAAEIKRQELLEADEAARKAAAIRSEADKKALAIKKEEDENKADIEADKKHFAEEAAIKKEPTPATKKRTKTRTKSTTK